MQGGKDCKNEMLLHFLHACQEHVLQASAPLSLSSVKIPLTFNKKVPKKFRNRSGIMKNQGYVLACS
jgi:hypothetical protein